MSANLGARHSAGYRARKAYSRMIHSSGCASRNSRVSRCARSSGVTSPTPISVRRYRQSTGTWSGAMDSSAMDTGAPAPYSTASWPGPSSSGSSVPRVSISSWAGPYPPPATGRSGSLARADRTASNSGRNMTRAGTGSVDRQRRQHLSRQPLIVAEFRSTSHANAAVSRTRTWLDGSCSPMLSRAGVVR